MGEVSPEVSEFRRVVDKAIQISVDRIESGPCRPIGFIDYRKHAAAMGMEYFSGDQYDTHPATLGHLKEKTWGVVSERFFHAGYSGRLAVVSSISKPDTLTRRWSIDSPMPQMPIETEKLIHHPALIIAVADWARSPHFEAETLSRVLAPLDETERERIEAEGNRLAASHDRLQAKLREIDEMHRRAWEHSNDHVIG